MNIDNILFSRNSREANVKDICNQSQSEYNLIAKTISVINTMNLDSFKLFDFDSLNFCVANPRSLYEYSIFIDKALPVSQSSDSYYNYVQKIDSEYSIYTSYEPTRHSEVTRLENYQSNSKHKLDNSIYNMMFCVDILQNMETSIHRNMQGLYYLLKICTKRLPLYVHNLVGLFYSTKYAECALSKRRSDNLKEIGRLERYLSELKSDNLKEIGLFERYFSERKLKKSSSSISKSDRIAFLEHRLSELKSDMSLEDPELTELWNKARTYFDYQKVLYSIKSVSFYQNSDDFRRLLSYFDKSNFDDVIYSINDTFSALEKPDILLNNLGKGQLLLASVVENISTFEEKLLVETQTKIQSFIDNFQTTLSEIQELQIVLRSNLCKEL